ncbi:TPA: D-glycerate dehydrogenase [Candidatus Nomurabacteria bacterium]|nr:MAG: hypothetical protein O210_OD1C00001G0170 [Parcubacteria bacterium RAAC4_OD1_1]HCY26633.1 D-glycerate dehydrogenase [Candidatus Nomurabacteria bacterium]
MHIFITRKIPDVGLKILDENNISYDIGNFKKPPTKKDLIKSLKKKNYDGIITFLTDTIDKEILDVCPNIKIIANFSVGFNNLDIEELKKRGIMTSNTPGTSSIAVAEHTVALMMSLTTRLVEGDRFVRSGKYKGWDPELLVGTDMKGKIIGLIGCGEIGTEVAKILNKGFGSKILYYDIVKNNKIEEETKAELKEIDEIFKTADIISLHVPLLPSTTHLINKDTLSTMKSSAFLINTSRGGVINEKDLVNALKNKIIRGAALDVFEYEPKLCSGLNKLSNVILTPHIASSRASARNQMAEIVVKNVVSVLKEGKVINSVIK